MKLFILQGSPRKKGNTAQIINVFIDSLPEEYNTTQMDCNDLDIHPCIGCNTCHKTLGTSGCVFKDDFQKVYQAMKDADVIIFTSPVYCWAFPAQMKVVLDRCYSLVKWHAEEMVEQLMFNKKCILVTTCGGSKEGNADLIIQIFEREMAYLGIEVLNSLVADNCSTPDVMGEVAKEIASAMIQTLVSNA